MARLRGIRAVATSFGISHPPGHPLSSIVFGLAQVFPLGSIAFRVAILCCVLNTVAAGFVFLTTDRVLQVLGIPSTRIRWMLASATTLWIALSYSWWFQAVRPEVYALQALLLSAATERLVRFETQTDASDLRPWFAAIFCVALALANHHFLAILWLAGLIPSSLKVLRASGFRPLFKGMGLGGLGVLLYVFLPLRAGQDPALNLGEPTTFKRLWWVISAQAFQKNQGSEVPLTLAERFADVAAVFVDGLHVAVLGSALLGLYVFSRIARTRSLALLFAVLIASFTAGRAWLGFIRSNPDAAGYLMPAIAIIGILAAGGLGTVITALAGPQGAREKLAASFALLLLLASFIQPLRSAKGTSLNAFADTDLFDEGGYRLLAPDAVLLAHNPQTIFRYWGVHAQEEVRPDITLIPMPFLTYPGMIPRLVSAHPELKSLLREYLAQGEIPQAEVQSLAAIRPVYVELDLRIRPALHATLIPSRAFHRVVADTATRADEAAGRDLRERQFDFLYSQLPEPIDSHTSQQLLWRHYMDALYYASFGDTRAAKVAIERGLAQSPHSEELLALRRALAQHDDNTPLNVVPFMVK